MALIVVVVAVVTARVVEQQMGAVLIAARGEGLRTGAERVSGMLAAGFPNAIRQFEERFAPATGARLFRSVPAADAMRALLAVRMADADSTRALAALLHVDGTEWAAVESRPTGEARRWGADDARLGRLDSTTLTVGPVLSTPSGPAFGLAYPIRGLQDELRGWYVELRLVRGRGVGDLRALIGVSTLLLGQAERGVWTDLEGEVAPPPSALRADSVQRVRTAARGDAIGFATGVRGTPWTLWVEEPSTRVLAPVRDLFRRLWPAVALVALVGAGFAMALGRLAARRIRAVADEIDRTLASQEPAAPPDDRVDELAQLERAYQRLEQRLAQQRRLDEQLLQSQKLEAVGRLAGGIAHDFNNLLTVVANYGELVRGALPAGSQAAEDMAEVLRATERAGALTRRLLAFSRQHRVDARPLDLVAAITASERMLARLIPSNVTRQLELPREPVIVVVDEIHFEQVMMNLVINAVDAMPDGGRLVIRLSRESLDAGEGAEAGRPGGDFACISVSDSGVGMTPETVARIFDPFFTTKAIGKGTGLGLATVHGIVTAANGRVWAYSEPGRGTNMKVYLPLAGAGAAAAADRTPVAARPRTPASGKVLVVEDDEATRTITERILTQAGYTVRTFELADTAAAWLEADPEAAELRAVVSDVMMPGMSGIDLARATGIRWPALPFVLMSGYSDTGTRIEDLPGPRPVVVEKPFSAAALLDAVHLAITPGAIPPRGTPPR